MEGIPVEFPGEGTFEFTPERQVGFGIGRCRGKAVPTMGEEIVDLKAQHCERIWHLGKMWVNTL